MSYFHEDLGEQRRGETIEVSVPRAGYVRLLNNDKYRLYRVGKRYQHNGGPIKQGNLRLSIPSLGHWHVVVEIPGLTPELCEEIKAQNVSDDDRID